MKLLQPVLAVLAVCAAVSVSAQETHTAVFDDGTRVNFTQPEWSGNQSSRHVIGIDYLGPTKLALGNSGSAMLFYNYFKPHAFMAHAGIGLVSVSGYVPHTAPGYYTAGGSYFLKEFARKSHQKLIVKSREEGSTTYHYKADLDAERSEYLGIEGEVSYTKFPVVKDLDTVHLSYGTFDYALYRMSTVQVSAGIDYYFLLHSKIIESESRVSQQRTWTMRAFADVILCPVVSVGSRYTGNVLPGMPAAPAELPKRGLMKTGLLIGIDGRMSLRVSPDFGVLYGINVATATSRFDRVQPASLNIHFGIYLGFGR